MNVASCFTAALALFTVHSVCGDVITNSRCNQIIEVSETPMNISSPGYPSSYSGNHLCWWKIISPYDDGHVQIDVTEYHHDGNNSECLAKVYDGDFITGTLIPNWCVTPSKRLKSTNNSISFVFTSYEPPIHAGLVILYLEKPRKDFGCGQKLIATETPKSIRSPGYPFIYTGNDDCSWQIISASGDARIQIDVVKFGHNFNESTCLVIVLDDNSENGEFVNDNLHPIDTWCDAPYPGLISSKNPVLLLFPSGQFPYRAGLVISYHEKPNFKCGGNLIAGSALLHLQSPGYPAVNYPNNLRCTWSISAKYPNERVYLKPIFSQLEVGGQDIVTVKSGFVVPDSFSGNYHAREYMSASSEMTVILETDGQNTFKGFDMIYKSVPNKVNNCGFDLNGTLDAKTFTSPGYPIQYENNLDCTWRIKVPHGHTVSLKVLESHIELSDYCSYDYVTVYDNMGELGKSCGNNTPEYRTRGQTMMVRFHSDSMKVRAGFRISYKSVPIPYAGCHSVPTQLYARTAGQYFTSPNYHSSGFYPNNADCSWRITAGNFLKQVTLDVKTSHLQKQTDGRCDHDYVEAFDGDDGNSQPLGKWCGDQTPTYQSTGNVMFVKFHSDDSIHMSGFRIKYYTTDSTDWTDSPDWTNSPYSTDSSDSSDSSHVSGGVCGTIALICLVMQFLSAIVF